MHLLVDNGIWIFVQGLRLWKKSSGKAMAFCHPHTPPWIVLLLSELFFSKLQRLEIIILIFDREDNTVDVSATNLSTDLIRLK